MRVVGGMTWRCGRLGLLAAAFVLLAGPVTADEAVLTPPQQAILDSLQTLNNTSGVDAVAALVSEHLPGARADDDSAFVMRLVGARGAANTFHRRPIQATGDLLEAIDLATTLGDSVSVARLLLWLARAYEVQGRHDESTDCYRRLTTLGRESDTAFYEARGLVGLAWDLCLGGDYATAESLYARAGTLAITAGDSFTVLWSRNGQGICYWNLGQLARADTAFATARREGRRTGISMVEAAAVNNHAGLLEILGRPGEALEGYRQSRQLNLASADVREAFPAGMNIARCQQQLGQLDASVSTIESLIAECTEAGYRDLLPGSLEHLAQVRLDQGRPALAARHARAGLAMTDVLRPRSELLLNLALAGALASQDSFAAALVVAERATESSFARGDLHMRAEAAVTRGAILTASGEHARAADVFAEAALDVEAAGLVYQQLSLKSRVGEALLLAGRSEAARPWLMDALLVWENTRTLPDDPIWRERRSGSAQRMFEALAQLTLVYPEDDLPHERMRRCFDLLQHYKARTLLERTLGPGRELADPRPVTLRELQRDALRDGEVFLDCYVGERHGLVFAVTRDTMLLQPLRGRDAVVAAVDVLQGQMDHPDRPFSITALASLASGLTTRLESVPTADGLPDLLTGASALVWSPDDALHRVPLALFFDEIGVAPVRTPSATFLANLRRGGGSQNQDPLRTLALAGASDGAGGTLDGAAREVRWLARRYAGVDAVIDTARGLPLGGHDLADYDLLHVAAHTEVDAQRPWSSALILGPVDEPRRMLAGAVAEQNLKARLAVLTSCNSASSAVLSGEGMLGLASGFLSAGIPAVVATLWPVDDRHAEQFSRRFYDELSGGHTAAEALQRTRAWLRSRPETEHPYHWAGYVLVGEGTRSLPLVRQRTGFTIWIAMAGAVVAAVIGAVARRRRQRISVKARV